MKGMFRSRVVLVVAAGCAASCSSPSDATGGHDAGTPDVTTSSSSDGAGGGASDASGDGRDDSTSESGGVGDGGDEHEASVAVPDAATADVSVADAANVMCADGGAIQCGAPTICPPLIQAAAVSGAVPAPTGGTIVPGLYVVTQQNVYATSAGYTAQYAINFTGSTFSESSYGGGPARFYSGTYTTSGTTLSRTFTCETLVGNQGDDSIPYSATASTLTMYFVPPNVSPPSALVLTRQ